ncbi:MAG: 16S rRNA (uracil(1498)-N(3))-methyltransferase [Candidatus Margulisbacteria bacterium]|jgi:16S rRNA (uracil1498-N3)-methyltransferase|nr:16S rRNA (uracil(1498)-N(3))-methyltransferase [Candidatus Margulisiibacteriota bacterium]
MLFRIYQPVTPVLQLTGEDFAYLTRVLRLSASDCFEAAQEQKIGVYQITQVGKNSLTALLQSAYTENNEPEKKLHLILPLLRADKLDYVLQKATEIGVYKFWLYAAENSPVRFGGSKFDRWRKIIVSAVCQSRRNHLPEITELKLTELPAEFAAVYYAHPAAEKRWPDFADNSALVIGPESGFAPAELNYLAVRASAFSLGGRILRAETAAVAAAARALLG